MKRWLMVAGVMAVTGIAACSSSDSVAPIGGPSSNLGTPGKTGGKDSSQGGSPTTPPSAGPAKTLSLSTHALDMARGYYAVVVATARDAAGVRVAKAVTWRSSNNTIVTVDTGGLVRANAVGSAKLYASIDGLTDSVAITVFAAPLGPPPSDSAKAVAQFNLTVSAFGSVSVADTTSAVRIPGATVNLFRVGDANGTPFDQPQPAGSAVTNANGEAQFSQLAGGSYSIRVTPPANSGYLAQEASIWPPSQSEVSVKVLLFKP